MPYTGAKSSVFLGVESSFNTAATLKYKLPFKSESINHKIEAVKSEALLGIRGTKTLAPGKEGAEGSIEVEAFPAITGLLFYLALGKAALQDPDGVAGSGDEYTEITPVDLNSSLPSATILVDHSGEKFYYTGMKVNTLKFSGAVGAIPSLSVDFVGVKENAGGLDTTSAQDPGDEPFYFKELKLYTDNFTTSTDRYSSIELNINNNLDTEGYRLDGTGYRKTIDEGNLEITGSLDIIFDSTAVSTEYNKYLSFTDASLGIELAKTSGDKIQIYISRLKFSEVTHDISGPEKIVLKANFTALIPTSGDIIVVKDYANTVGNY